MAGYGQGLEANAYNEASREMNPSMARPGTKGGGKPRAGMGGRRMPLAQMMAAANTRATPQSDAAVLAAQSQGGVSGG